MPKWTMLVLLACSGATHAMPQIPLCPGLTIVTAVSQPIGDYESIKTVETVSAAEARLKYSSEAPNADSLSPNFGQLIKTTVYRRLLMTDLDTADQYEQVFAPDSDELLPGTTAIGTSKAVLVALKSRGEAKLSVSNVYAGVPLKVDRKLGPSAYDYFTAGTLKRVGIVKVPVLVNDRLVELSAIQASGDYVGDKHEFLFLDDDANPLTLKFRLGIDSLKPMVPELKETCAQLRKAHGNSPAWATIGKDCREKAGDRDVLQVVKISYRCTGPELTAASGQGSAGAGEAPAIEGAAKGSGEGSMEQALQQGGKIDIYSIYFSFNSDVIREESEPTLKEIGALMRKHPEWKLSISGHTDNIASDKYNLDLSQRRAAAVVKALTTRYGVKAERLTFSGMGEAAPKDTNDTLEGRAKNRRVELARIS